MPRDVPLGNGRLLVALDARAQIRDLYWPHVGQPNHALGHPFRVGLWADGEFRWLEDPGWEVRLDYDHDTLVGKHRLRHPDLGLEIRLTEAVDFHEPLYLRRFEIVDLLGRARQVRLFLHHDFHLNGNEVGDTAYYEPDARAVLHYKGPTWFLINGAVQVSEEEPGPWPPLPGTAPGLVSGVHQWACGLKEIHGLQGTWRDAEDGRLEGGPVAHGSVDSCVGFSIRLPARGGRVIHTWLAAGPDLESVSRLNLLARQRGPEAFLHRTAHYWRLWLHTHTPDFQDLPHEICHQYRRSLLIVRTQVDQGGAILAANDTDISSAVRDTYSYMWPRDGALVAEALTTAGYIDRPRAFFGFCARVLASGGYLLHKYNPDSTLASSWHPWYRDGRKDLPIQEDETALVLWALRAHFERHGDVEFVKPLYRGLVTPAADFLVRFRDPDSGLPLPSYDLWEERHGVHGWTVAATFAGLEAAARFAEDFGETGRAEAYRAAALSMRDAFEQRFWLEDRQHFARTLRPLAGGGYETDPTLDASLAGLWLFGMYPPDHPKVAATMEAIARDLWVQTEIGGVARYLGDQYHRASPETEQVPGNPWFITTLWLAMWRAETARDTDDLAAVADLLRWACDRALPSGVLAEQVHPHTGEPLSVSPLTWSHATLVRAVHTYLRARRLAAEKEG